MRFSKMRFFKYPHPITSGHIAIAFHPGTLFGGTCFAACFNSNHMTESAKAYGSTIWWVRVLCFTVSYRRLL